MYLKNTVCILKISNIYFSNLLSALDLINSCERIDANLKFMHSTLYYTTHSLGGKYLVCLQFLNNYL